ncbi:MAG: PilN domain-containing protein [Phycisphaerales bacterium]|nr:PilN domain-containing protein [Phycisphaerales bacterium]
MPTIDLMPSACRHAIDRRLWTRRWVAMYITVLLAMIGVNWGLSMRQQSQKTTLASMTLQVDENLRRNKERTRLIKQIEQTQTMVDRYNRVAWPVHLSDVVGSVAQVMPDSVTLSSLAVTPRRVNPNRSKKDAQEQVFLVVELEGVAPDDMELASFVSGLESHGLFQKVTLDYARSTTVRDIDARGFRMSAEIDLQKTYVFAHADGEAPL